MTNAALVLFSGGQDSTVALAWALQRYDHVETIGFQYGQRHDVELQCRLVVLREIRQKFPAWATKLGEDHLLTLDSFGEMSVSALTRDTAIEVPATGLPNTFVPGRNLLFFTYAAALAYRLDVKHLIGGMCETDFSGYPDCRDDALKALQVALSLGMDRRFILHTPLMWLDKAATWDLTVSLGGNGLRDIVIEHTNSCYLGDRDHRHAWGYGCGTCPACNLRRDGYISWQSENSSGS